MYLKPIKKQLIAATALYAATNMPGIDQKTMLRLLDLVETSGEFSWITGQELIEQMRLLLKYIPGTCRYSLQVLAELLELSLPGNRPAAWGAAGTC